MAETVDITRLPRCPDKTGNWFCELIMGIGTTLPVPGVYVIFDPNKVIYVGSAVDVRRRIGEHRRALIDTLGYGPMQLVFVKWSPSRKYGDWAMREIRLIRRLRPESNLQHNVTRK